MLKRICASNDIVRKRDNFIANRKYKVPLMGKSILIAKHSDVTIMQLVNESDIVTNLVLQKFRNILEYYRERRSRRSKYRSQFINTFSENGTMEELELENSDNRDLVVLGNSAEQPEIFVEEKTEYDPQKFLVDALGEELHNYPTTNSESESIRTNRIKDFNDDYSIGTSDISALLSKSNSSYSHFSRKLKRCNTQASSSMYDKTLNDENLNTTLVDSKATHFINEAAVQHEIIIQTSKALNLCLNSKVFSTDVYIEAERILLLAIAKREAVITELKFLEYEDLVEDTCFGHIEIADITFPATDSGQSGRNANQWFFVLAICGPNVFATKAIKLEDQDQISFQKKIKFEYLSSDFEVLLKLYTLNLCNTRPCNRDLSLSTTMETTMCPSPNHLLNFRRKSNAKVKRLYSYERREPSFTLYGSVKINISDLRRSEFILSNVSCNSNLFNNVNLKISSSIEFSEHYYGFLTIGSEAGGLAIWNRRWCVLDGSVFKYWNYPQEEEFCEALNSIDLSYCVTSSVFRAHREMCARPRTLVIETGRLSKLDDTNSLMVFRKSSYTITRYYLSTDSVEELEIWEKKLNSVVFALRNWNCLNCPVNLTV